MKRENIKRAYEIISRLEQIDKDMAIVNTENGDNGIFSISTITKCTYTIGRFSALEDKGTVEIKITDSQAKELALKFLNEEKQELEKELEGLE